MSTKYCADLVKYILTGAEAWIPTVEMRMTQGGASMVGGAVITPKGVVGSIAGAVEPPS